MWPFLLSFLILCLNGKEPAETEEEEPTRGAARALHDHVEAPSREHAALGACDAHPGVLWGVRSCGWHRVNEPAAVQ